MLHTLLVLSSLLTLTSAPPPGLTSAANDALFTTDPGRSPQRIVQHCSAGSEGSEASRQALGHSPNGLGRGADEIFSNGFETGTHAWSAGTAFIQFGSGRSPIFNVDDCNLPPGEYTFKLEAENLDGTQTLEYPLTVVQVICSSGMCNEYTLGTPTVRSY